MDLVAVFLKLADALGVLLVRLAQVIEQRLGGFDAQFALLLDAVDEPVGLALELLAHPLRKAFEGLQDPVNNHVILKMFAYAHSPPVR